MDLSLTKYSDDWKDAHLANDPEYTEEMQRFDRWCRRCYELGRSQELNEAYKLSNDNERRRRREPNEFLDRRIAKVLGQECSGEKVFGDGSVHFTNEGFDPDWMDADLIEHGIPVIELMKEWLLLNGSADGKPEREKIEEEIKAECIWEIVRESVKKEKQSLGSSVNQKGRRQQKRKTFAKTASNRRKNRLGWLSRR